MSKEKISVRVWCALVIVGLAVAVETGLMAKKSALSWTFQQQEYWSAITEIVICFALLTGSQFALRNKRKYALLCVCLVILAFCYIHQYFAAILLGGIYVVFIYLVGTSICKVLQLGDLGKTWQAKTVIGISGIFVLIAIASLLKVGTPEKLRVIVICIFAALLFFARDDLKKQICTWRNRLGKQEEISLSMVEILLLSGIISFVLIQVGRANIALDYDSVWYGLRSEYMLAPKTGIYDPMPFLACVHTYAKGIETLTLPLSGMGSFGFLYSVNIIFGIAIIKCVYDICRFICGKTSSMLAALFTSAIPGIMNMTVTAKSDILTLFLQITAVFFLADGVQKKEKERLFLGISSCILSYAFKPTSALFSTVILVVCVMELICLKNRFGEKSINAIAYMGCSILGLGVIWARTFLMTGCPFTFILPKIFQSLGAEIKYPYEFYTTWTSSGTGQSQVEFLLERLHRVFEILVYPVSNETDHIIIAWGGPVFVFLCGMAVAFLLRHPRRALRYYQQHSVSTVVWLLFVLLGGFVFCCVMTLWKPDGNYFMLYYVISAIAATFSFEEIKNIKNNNYYILLAIPILLSAVLFTTATNWAWALGFTKTDLSTFGYYDSVSWVKQTMKSEGLGDIFSQLESENKPKVEIFSNKMQYAVFIPATTDLYLMHRSFASSSTSTKEEYLKYLQFADMDYLLIDRGYLREDIQAKEIISALAQDGNLEMSQSNDKWALVKVLHDSENTANSVLKYINGCVLAIEQGVYDDGWAGEFVKIDTENNMPQKLVITGYCPWDIEDGMFIEIAVDENLVNRYEVMKSTIQIEVELGCGTHTIQLQSNFAREATPPDIRTNLAFVMTDYYFE